MANTYVLSTTSITQSAIGIQVQNWPDDNSFADSKIILRVSTAGGAWSDKTFSLSNINYTGSSAPYTVTATITPSSAFGNTDSSIIQIKNTITGTDNFSDRVFVDFREDMSSSANSKTFPIELPVDSDEAGSYKLQVSQVNGEAPGSTIISANAFVLGTKPTGGSITIPKDYLVKFVGSTIPATVTLSGLSSDSGNYELQIVNQKQ